MRKRIHRQLRLVPGRIDHFHARELEQISEILDAMPDAISWAHDDLVEQPAASLSGRAGMTTEQVLRALIVKQLNGFSYEQLAFHLEDSLSYRRFCRFGLGQSAPKRSTLQANIKRISARTLEMTNRILVRYAVEQGVESGTKVRVDCTVIDANIHHPTDSTLLGDSMRVLVRLMKRARRWVPLRFTNHLRRARRRVMEILNAKAHRFMIPKYRELLNLLAPTIASARSFAQRLAGAQERAAQRVCEKLLHFIQLADGVVDQTRQRVFEKQKVAATDKIVSIFEPHADVIVKDRRDTLYGHKVCLASGSSGLVLELRVLDGNPGDKTIAVDMVDRCSQRLGRCPRHVAFDGGFASRQNYIDMRKLGVASVVFSKSVGLAITEMARSHAVYRALRNFRAGIEAEISALKRAFGFDRCPWRGRASFEAYAHASVLACNLLVLARQLLH